MVWGQRSKIRKYSVTFKLLSKDINLNVGNKKITIMKGYPRAPVLESKVKNVKVQETS